MAQVRILIVDDEPTVLEGLQLAFEGVDWHIEVELSGAGALKRVDQGFDLVITDKNLPDIDGVELIRRIRAKNADIRFVMITGFGSANSAVEVANLGVEAYIEKPFKDVFEVRAQVEALLETDKPIGRISQVFAWARKQKKGRLDSALPPAQSVARIAEPEQGEQVPSEDRPLILVASADLAASARVEALLQGVAKVVHATSVVSLIEQLSKQKKIACVLIHSALDAVELALRIRSATQGVAIVVASEHIDLATAKALIASRVNALIQEPVGASEFAHRLLDIVSGLEAKR